MIYILQTVFKIFRLISEKMEQTEIHSFSLVEVRQSYNTDYVSSTWPTLHTSLLIATVDISRNVTITDIKESQLVTVLSSLLV